MDSQEINKFIKENVDKIYDEMVKVRRTIHENPELGDFGKSNFGTSHLYSYRVFRYSSCRWF